MGRPGVVLLEVLAAMLILSTAGLASASMVRQSMAALALARAADEEMARASAFLDAVSLWTRDDLDRRLGIRTQGDWRMIISRETPMLYTVVLTDSSTRTVILRTALYRPVGTDNHVW